MSGQVLDHLLDSPAGESPALPAPAERRLTDSQFHQLAAMPAAAQWFANLDNPQTRRAYRGDIEDFAAFVGLAGADEFRQVSRGHVLAWRAELEQRGLAGATIRRKLAALATLFDFLLESNAVAGGNPVHGVKRPPNEWANEGKTPALGDDQAKRLLNAPPADTLKGARDRAIIAVLLYHGLRRAEVAQLKSVDLHDRRGIKYIRVKGKGGKNRYLPLHPAAADWVHQYLELDARKETDANPPLFRSIRGRSIGAGITANGIYMVMAHWALVARVDIAGLGVHGLRVTAATNALDNGADIAKVQEWLGHANISTTRLYDRRGQRAEDSPTFKVRY